MPKKIIIIEDNQDMANLLAIHLRDQNYLVTLCFDGKSGLDKLQQERFDLMILDLMLPKISGLEICQRVRKQGDYTPILMLTAKSTELDRVMGLETGADDYVTKPFSLTEVLARIHAIFRRVDALQAAKPEEDNSIIIHQGLQIDINKHHVIIDGEDVELTSKEFALLLFFIRHPGRVYTREQLLDHVWGFGHDGYEHTVNSHINRLRVKIEKNPREPVFILTVWGVGYKFNDQPD